MITLLTHGHYQLGETKTHVKILYLERQGVYAWVDASEIGAILVYTLKKHRFDRLLSIGHYRVYKVKDEPHLSDQMHLELNVGHHTWQGYLLPTGFPTKGKKRARFIPTKECITTLWKATVRDPNEENLLMSSAISK